MTLQRTHDSGTNLGSTIREELGDEIYIISPMDTPLLSLLDHESVRQRDFDWLMDIIRDPTARAGELEGFTVGDTGNVVAANRTRQRVTNATMINALAIHVSHSQRLANEAGVEDEYSYQVAQKGLELLKQVDFELHFSEFTDGANATPQHTAGLWEWLITLGIFQGTNAGAGGATTGDSIIAGTRVPLSQFRSNFWVNNAPTTAMTETQFNQLTQTSWNLGMDINAAILFCGGAVKRLISDFGNVYSGGTGATDRSAQRRIIDAADKRRILPIDFYYTDFGELGVALDRRMDSNTTVLFEAMASDDTNVFSAAVSGQHVSAATGGGIRPSNAFFAIDPAFHSVAVFQPFYYEEIARRGNSTEGYVVMEHGYKCRNPGTMYGATNVTSTTFQQFS